MNFAAPYVNYNCPLADQINEYNIIFKEHNSWANLDTYASMFKDKRINVCFKDVEIDMRELENLCIKYDNVYVRITPDTLKAVPQLKEKNIRFFLDNTMMINSYSLLEYAIQLKPTDIYIGEELLYNLNEVRATCNANNIKIRMVLNRAPVLAQVITLNYTVPVFRPQDYHFLNEYIDCGEFDCGEKYDWTKAKVLYQKWYVDHAWDDELVYLNTDIAFPYPTSSMPVELVKYRSNCKHRCVMFADNHCGKCKRFYTLGLYNEKRGIKYDNTVTSTLPSLDDAIDSLIVNSKSDK